MVKKRLVKDLHRHIRLEVDGRLVELPPVEGIIILNILRYALFVDFKFLIKDYLILAWKRDFCCHSFYAGAVHCNTFCKC